MEPLGGLLWLLLIGVAFFFLMSKAGCGIHGGGHDHGSRRSSGGHVHDMHGSAPSSAQDPVCGMRVDPSDAVGVRTAAGRTFYFCSADCLAKFDHDPGRYTLAAESAHH